MWLDYVVSGTITAAQVSKILTRMYLNNERNEEAFYCDGSVFDILTTILNAYLRPINAASFPRYADDSLTTSAVQAFAEWDFPCPIPGKQFSGRIDLASPTGIFSAAPTSPSFDIGMSPIAVDENMAAGQYYIEGRELDNIQTLNWSNVRGFWLNFLDAGGSTPDWNGILGTFKVGGGAYSQQQITLMQSKNAQILRSACLTPINQTTKVFSGQIPKYDPGTVGYYTLGGFFPQPTSVQLRLKSLQTIYPVTLTDKPFEPIGSAVM